MRIAFVPAARVLTEHEPNGESLIATAMIRALAARGHQVLAYCEHSDLEQIDGVEVRALPVEGPTAGLARLRWAKRIARDVAAERIDVAHLLFPFNTDEGYAHVRSVPLVAGPVNVAWPGGPTSPRSLTARGLAALVRRREQRAHLRTIAAARRLFLTGASARAALPASVHGRCEDLPFGVDTARFLPRPLPAEPTIVFPSVLIERKGIEVLIRAMPDVMRRIPRARLLVAGSDPVGLRAKMEDLAVSLGVAADVTFLGQIAPAKVPALFERATVVCQPSLGEPFGMTVIEAMASGRAVVGTAAGGIPDAIVDGSGGRLVPAGDPRLLADALCSILGEPRTAEDMGAFNRARAEQRYALGGVIERIEAAYRAVVGEPERVHVA